MSHSDLRFDEEFRLSKQSRRILKQLRKKGAYSSNRFSPEEVLYLELGDRVERWTARNWDYVAVELLDRYDGAEPAIEALRSGKVKLEKVPSRSGADDTGLQITLSDPDESDVLLVFFVDTEDEDSLVDFLDSLREIYGDDEAAEIIAKILGVNALARAVCGGLVREGKLIRVGDDKYVLANDTGLLH